LHRRQSQVPKESAQLDGKSVFPLGSTVGGDLGERRLAQRFPGLLTRKRPEVHSARAHCAYPEQGFCAATVP